MGVIVEYFEENGRRVADKGLRVYGSKPSFYYQLSQPEIEYEEILAKSKKFNSVPVDVGSYEFKYKAETLLKRIKASHAYGNLLKGVMVPFLVGRITGGVDLGEELKSSLLPSLKESFNVKFPEAHFKAVLQSNSELTGNITLSPSSRYEELISALEQGPVVGWYFPQALQEFDVHSQRVQMDSLPKLEGAGVCLSGGIDICAAVAGTPDLLISDEFYTPILCMSSYVHRDPRLVLLLKAYGPHMEFWCMTQMLTIDTAQVSEQWAGGITIYNNTSF
jgi:hypothetical protein